MDLSSIRASETGGTGNSGGTLHQPYGDIRVLVVADDQLARDGLAALIADQPECSVAGQLTGPEYTTTALGIYSPDVVARDLWMAFDPLPRVAR